jgi:hypothetical protein
MYLNTSNVIKNVCNSVNNIIKRNFTSSASSSSHINPIHLAMMGAPGIELCNTNNPLIIYHNTLNNSLTLISSMCMYLIVNNYCYERSW